MDPVSDVVSKAKAEDIVQSAERTEVVTPEPGNDDAENGEAAEGSHPSFSDDPCPRENDNRVGNPCQVGN